MFPSDNPTAPIPRGVLRQCQLLASSAYVCALLFLALSFLLPVSPVVRAQQLSAYSSMSPPYISSRYPQSSPSPTYYGDYSPYSRSFNGKPSYAYFSPYAPGYGGLSGYEGPPYGVNAYWQPGIAYGYGGGAMYASGGLPMGSTYGGVACNDRSADCALLASSGQCATSASVRAMCAQSCGVGCAGAIDPSMPFRTGYGPSAAPSTRLHPPSASPLHTTTTNGRVASEFGQFGYGGGLPPYSQYGGSAYGRYGNRDLGPPFACRDSHIYGCPQWAAQGLCQQVPEYMLNYCRGSCGDCARNGRPSYGGYSNGGFDGGPYGSGGGYGGSGELFPSVGQYGGGAGMGGFGGGPGGLPMGSGSADLAAGLSAPPFVDFSADFSRGSTDVFGPTPLSAFSSPGLLSSLYSPYYAGFFPSSLERKEKQQKGSKAMFSEDEPSSNSGLTMSSPLWATAGSVFDQQQPPLPQVFDNELKLSPSLLNWPPSSLSSQHSALSKMVRMDDLALDKQLLKSR